MEFGGGVLDELLLAQLGANNRRASIRITVGVRNLRPLPGRMSIAPKEKMKMQAAAGQRFEAALRSAATPAAELGTEAVILRVAELEPFTVGEAGLTLHPNWFDEGVQVSVTGTPTP